MQKRIIAPGVYFDGDNLIEYGQIIPVGTKKQKKIIEKLLDARGNTVSYSALYQYAWEDGQNEYPDGIMLDDRKKIQDLCTKLPGALKKYVKNVTNMGYRLLIQETFKVDPQYTAEKMNAGEVFAPCEKNIRQDAALDELRKEAFMPGKKVVVITGGPGMGKTELAKSFAYDCCREENPLLRLRYENIILTTYQKEGLAATIRNLPVEGTCDENEWDQRVWDGLRNLKKPTLLVIDNADMDLTEEGWDEKTFENLKRTGCNILLTSRKDLSSLLEAYVLEIPPLETQQLVKLFCDISGENLEETQKAKLEILIEACLQNNVYLVTLAAGLMESITVDELFAAYEITGELGKMDAVTGGYKDGRKQKADTLTGHFVRLYRMCDMTPSEKRLMLNLALLPIDGMNSEDFYRCAYTKKDRKQANQDFKNLQERRWVLLSNRKVSLHPMVREAILAEVEGLYNDDTLLYLRSAADAMNHTHYSPKLHSTLKFGLNAFDAIRIREITSFEAAQLAAQIASVYDTLTEKQNAYTYGIEAIHRMDAEDRAKLSGEDLFRLAQCYNVAGYAVLHGEDIATARRALMEAEKILKNLLHSYPSKEKTESVMILRSKVSGNLAACFHAEQDYARSINLHEEALKYRLDVNSSSAGKYTDMVASAYKNVATEYFYLSRTEDQQLNLEKSYENHCKAVGLYEELGPDYKLEWCVAVNRMVGTRLHILETAVSSDKTVFGEHLEIMVSVFSYLSSIDPVKAELNNCLGNIVRIIKLQKCNEISKDSAVRVLKLAGILPQEIQKDLQEQLAFIQESV